MVIFTQLYQQLGLLTWPFTLLSLITLTIFLDRCWALLRYQRHCRKQGLKQYLKLNNSNNEVLSERLQNHAKTDRCLKGVQLLIAHSKEEKSIREDIGQLWLKQTRQHLISGVKILSIIALISPLMGLLGTVLGLIDMFQSLGAHSGSIEASQLAKGLGFAMSTTAMGLLLALPALLLAHIFQSWADRLVQQLEDELNYCNLLISGAQIESMEAL
jgi:biopolymer transport protein ExbB